MEKYCLDKNTKIDMNILGMNEQIIRRIFKLLSDKDVYFTLRKICRRFKIWVDQYIQLRGILLLLHWDYKKKLSRHFLSSVYLVSNCAHEEIQTKLIYVFSRNNKVSSMSWIPFEPIPPCPNYYPRHRHMHFQPFGSVVNGKILVFVRAI